MKIGFTCSTFDLFHAGHLLMLEEAKKQCDYLIVGLQTDPTIGVLAEIINAPKLNNKIEKMRDKVDTLETVSIANFAKHKKIGARQIHFIKKIKDKYGNNILKFLNLYM